MKLLSYIVIEWLGDKWWIGDVVDDYDDDE